MDAATAPRSPERPSRAGLRVTYAADRFLFATKLIAQRAKDANDVIALAKRLEMQEASADELESHIRRYYTDEAALKFIVDGDDVDRELRYLAEDAARHAQAARVALGLQPGSRTAAGRDWILEADRPPHGAHRCDTRAGPWLHTNESPRRYRS